MSLQSHSVKTLYLLRHGALTQSNILCGHSDITLSSNGWQQLEQATLPLSNITHCYSSSLQRCANFATHYAQKHELPLSIDKRLMEMNFGDWDGLPYKTLWDTPTSTKSTSQETDKTVYLSDFWRDPWQHSPPNGETMSEFSTRVDNVWADISSHAFSQVPSAKGDCLIVTHGGVIKYLLARILQIPLSNASYLNTIQVNYGALVKVTLFNDGEKIWPQVIFQ